MVHPDFKNFLLRKIKFLTMFCLWKTGLLIILKNLIMKKISCSKYKYQKYLVSSRQVILFGLAKILQPTKDDVSPFSPILSTNKTSTYKLAKILVLILEQ